MIVFFCSQQENNILKYWMPLASLLNFINRFKLKFSIKRVPLASLRLVTKFFMNFKKEKLVFF